MKADVAREVRVLIDRYLEVSNHYARELQQHLKDYRATTSRLNALITGLEALEEFETSAIHLKRSVDASEQEPAQGQNIVRTPDTLAALRVSADEILERLKTPIGPVPRNFAWLRKWLQRDIVEIAAGFPSFTFTWDKIIDLNRLTLVPDSRLLRLRDDVSLATMEFERFVLELLRLTRLAERAPSQDADDYPIIAPEDALKNLCTSNMKGLDSSFDERVSRVLGLLRRPKDSLEQTFIREAERDIEALALVGLELGFTRWLGFIDLSKDHRKSIIMSLLVCSKLFLIETSWRNARDISKFAIELTAKMNADLALDTTEGTAMLRFNQLWARHKLGENVREELEQWDVSGTHPRYSFLKSVLLRNFEDATRILETLLPKKNSGEPGNFSLAEAEEWPILEDFRSSSQYENFKKRLNEQGAR